MPYKSPYDEFIFEGFSFDKKNAVATFNYSFDGKRSFFETVRFNPGSYSQEDKIDERALESVLQLAFYCAGVSYYKTFPTTKIKFLVASPDVWQAQFLEEIYTKGLSQFFFENNLSKANMPKITGLGSNKNDLELVGEGSLVLQSGGKDSLLLSTLLEEKNIKYTPWYIKYSQTQPAVLNDLSQKLVTVERVIDNHALARAKEDGGLNGHVPVTYIVLSYALIDAVLRRKNTVLAAIGAEGGEPHEFIEDVPVNHQWAKSWEAEQLFSEYVSKYISTNIKIGSPLRGFSELRIAELFVDNAWEKFGHSFSSCNRANYQQGADNSKLRWCGDCPKCANSYLLFAPFVQPEELQSLFDGQDLFKKTSLNETFKGLLSVDGVMKPFECVGEIAELRSAYHMARAKYGKVAYSLPFEVPESHFDYKATHPHSMIEPNLYNI